ncbi:MAG: 3-deoxy-D-manno-octulosonic acid kinase [Pseudomonadota bacterium]
MFGVPRHRQGRRVAPHRLRLDCSLCCGGAGVAVQLDTVVGPGSSACARVPTGRCLRWYTRARSTDGCHTITTPRSAVSVREDPPWTLWSDPAWSGTPDASWLDGSTQRTPVSGGRGAAWFVDIDGVPAVVRRYRRGGLPARLSERHYVYTGLTRSRPWREWQLTQALFDRGLPVPRPLFAGLRRAGVFYEAALVTQRLPAAISLAEALAAGEPAVDWGALGATVARFHIAGVDHVDLNAFNLMWSGAGWHLIDFDRCRLGKAGGRWARSNCRRLARSLRALDIYDDAGWVAFDAAYSAAMPSR